jgi:hypothetical protein
LKISEAKKEKVLMIPRAVVVDLAVEVLTVVNGFTVVVAWIGGSDAIFQFNIIQTVVLI